MSAAAAGGSRIRWFDSTCCTSAGTGWTAVAGRRREHLGHLPLALLLGEPYVGARPTADDRAGRVPGPLLEGHQQGRRRRGDPAVLGRDHPRRRLGARPAERCGRRGERRRPRAGDALGRQPAPPLPPGPRRPAPTTTSPRPAAPPAPWPPARARWARSGTPGWPAAAVAWPSSGSAWRWSTRRRTRATTSRVCRCSRGAVAGPAGAVASVHPARPTAAAPSRTARRPTSGGPDERAEGAVGHTRTSGQAANGPVLAPHTSARMRSASGSPSSQRGT